MIAVTPERRSFLEAERAKWLTVREAAFVLRVSSTKILRLIEAGEIPARREGRKIRVHSDDLRPRREVA